MVIFGMSKIVALSIFLLSFSANAETWIQYDEKIECPDVLELSGNNFIIFNDCYGLDPKEPIIETGKVEIGNNYFFFSDRKIKQQSFLQENTKRQKLKVLLKTKDELKLQSGTKVFMFKRIKLPN